MSDICLSELTKFPDFDHPPKRVVSLVPSVTESLFDLGFGTSVVGITDYCIHPEEKLINVPRVGGIKNPDPEIIKNLHPDIVFANQEENSPEIVKALTDAGIRVWLSFPKTVDESLDVLRNILAIYHTDKPALQITSIQMAADYSRNASVSLLQKKYFCPIWHGKEDEVYWWMTFNWNTYSHDLLGIFGGENVFADRERLYPLEADLGIGEADKIEGRDIRYPRVTVEEIYQAAPELILLPNEPFAFKQDHKQLLLKELKTTPAVKNNRIQFVDGSLITWHGTRIGKALQELPKYFE